MSGRAFRWPNDVLSINWDAKLYSLTAYCSPLYVVFSALSLSLKRLIGLMASSPDRLMPIRSSSVCLKQLNNERLQCQLCVRS